MGIPPSLTVQVSQFMEQAATDMIYIVCSSENSWISNMRENHRDVIVIHNDASLNIITRASQCSRNIHKVQKEVSNRARKRRQRSKRHKPIISRPESQAVADAWEITPSNNDLIGSTLRTASDKFSTPLRISSRIHLMS